MHLSPKQSLTRRETQILRQVATGKRSIDIANELGLSKHTVDNHRKNILHKTGCKNTLEMVQWGQQNGLFK